MRWLCISKCRRRFQAPALSFRRQLPVASLTRRAVNAQHSAVKLAQPLAKVLMVVFLSVFCSNVFHKGPAVSRGPSLEGLLGSHVCQAMKTEGLDIADGVEGQNTTGRQVVCG